MGRSIAAFPWSSSIRLFTKAFSRSVRNLDTSGKSGIAKKKENETRTVRIPSMMKIQRQAL